MLGNKNEYYTDLLQITLRNENFVFDLSDAEGKKPMEIGYVHGID